MSGYSVVAAVATVIFLIMAFLVKTGKMRVESIIGLSEENISEYDEAVTFAFRYFLMVAGYYCLSAIILNYLASSDSIGLVVLLVPFVTNQVYLKPRLSDFVTIEDDDEYEEDDDNE
ncbi:hypothetical protein [Vallitalea okinawensis]|uniref:hypothetical protein n=1 Tax=Vallitalea okinawensis TaxID=2078660 RepID=UPI000CFB52BD|nr:hypothetical protein [Vallitalea okinawensis]